MYVTVFLVAFMINLSQQILNVPSFVNNGFFNSSMYNGCLKIQSNSNFLARLSSQWQINIWNSQNKAQVNILTDALALMNDANNQTLVQDFSLISKHEIAILNQSYFVTKNLTNGVITHNRSVPQSFTGRQIELTDNFLFILTHQTKLLIFNRQSINQHFTYDLSTTFSSPALKSSVCQNRNSISYIVIWDSTTNILLLECHFQFCNEMTYIPNTNSSTSYATQRIQFNQQCTFMVYEIDRQTSIKVYDLEGNKPYRSLFVPNQVIYRTQFYDTIGQSLLIYCQNNSILLYNLTQNSFMTQIILNITFDRRSIFSQKSRIMYIANDTYIMQYNLICAHKQTSIFNSINICFNCGNCEVYHYCQERIGQCVLIKEQYQIFQLQINSQTIQMVNHYAIKPISKAASYTILFIQMTPIAMFCVSFINFWNICSLYSLIQAQLPKFLRQMLDQIYETVNFSIFKLLGIEFQIDIGLQNTFVNTHLQPYGISSNFVQMHQEDIVKFFMCCMVLFVCYLIRRILGFFNLINQKKKIQYDTIILTQFITNSFIFILPFKIFFVPSVNSNYKEKFNISIHTITILFALIGPFIIILPQSKDQMFKYKKIKTLKRLQNYLFSLETFQIYYSGLSTSFIALFIMLESNLLTFIGSLCIYNHGFKATKRSKQFRTNKIILALYLPFFHISFFLVQFFRTVIKNQSLNQLFSFICAIILIVGALHQALNLIFQICYQIYCYISKRNLILNSSRLQIIKKKNIFLQNQIIPSFASSSPKYDQYFASSKYKKPLFLKRAYLSTRLNSLTKKQNSLKYKKVTGIQKNVLVLNKICRQSLIEKKSFQQNLNVKTFRNNLTNITLKKAIISKKRDKFLIKSQIQ